MTKRSFHKFMSITFIVVTVFLLQANPAEAHSVVIDGDVSSDWCAPNFVGAFGADTLTVITPAMCPMGTEFLWDDYDAVNYGSGSDDVIGHITAGALDPEVDIDFFQPQQIQPMFTLQ